jgi:hypothetical protein
VPGIEALSTMPVVTIPGWTERTSMFLLKQEGRMELVSSALKTFVAAF